MKQIKVSALDYLQTKRLMKKTILIITSIFSAAICFSQQQTGNKVYDFKKGGPHPTLRQIKAEQERIKDSLMNTAVLDSLEQLYERVSDETRSYNGVSFSVGFPSSRLTKINQELRANGFNPLSGNLTEIGLGIIYKRKRWIHESKYGISFSNKSSQANTQVKIYEGNGQYTVGYALLDLPWLTLYPFAGPSYQTAQLTVDKQPSYVSVVSSLFETATRFSQTMITKNQINISAGGELDFRILKQMRNNPGLILSAKYGGSWLGIDGRYRANHHPTSYFPDWDFRNSYWEFSLKVLTL